MTPSISEVRAPQVANAPAPLRWAVAISPFWASMNSLRDRESLSMILEGVETGKNLNEYTD